jgi:hypothetical protein
MDYLEKNFSVLPHMKNTANIASSVDNSSKRSGNIVSSKKTMSDEAYNNQLIEKNNIKGKFIRDNN